MADKVEQKDPIEQEWKPVTPEVADAPAPSMAYPMDKVFWVNRLLQIEDLDLTWQLKQAISNFLNFTYLLPLSLLGVILE